MRLQNFNVTPRIFNWPRHSCTLLIQFILHVVNFSIHSKISLAGQLFYGGLDSDLIIFFDLSGNRLMKQVFGPWINGDNYFCNLIDGEWLLIEFCELIMGNWWIGYFRLTFSASQSGILGNFWFNFWVKTQIHLEKRVQTLHKIHYKTRSKSFMSVLKTKI